MSNTLTNIINNTLYFLIQNRDKGLLQKYCKILKHEFNVEECLSLFDSFFDEYCVENKITDDDVSFFQDMMDDFINKVALKKKEITEEQHLKNIKKQIVFFKKKFNWELGQDYSFSNGRIYMSKKNKEKLRETIS